MYLKKIFFGLILWYGTLSLYQFLYFPKWLAKVFIINDLVIAITVLMMLLVSSMIIDDLEKRKVNFWSIFHFTYNWILYNLREKI